MAGRRVVVVLAAMVLGAALVAQEQPTFRAETTLVEVSAIVTRDGVPVTDLRQDEVRVLDNGVEQPLVAFEYVDLTTVEGPAQRRDFVLVVVAAIVVCFVATIYPSRQASRLDPAQALRYQ